ncbi:MAG: hypothetical protein K8F91_22380 [Candidatus Obscuribacterales bacterium]|nr:hypothetical protein [Candidatus Obscuribacterales bacterium]
MYTVLLGGLIGLLVLFMTRKRVSAFPGGTVFSGFICVIFGAGTGVVLSAALGILLPGTLEVDSTVELVSLRTTESMNGVFVLASGNIEQETAYRVMVKNSDGSFSPRKVPAASDTRIFEDESLQGRGTLTIRRDVVGRGSSLSNWIPALPKQRRVQYELRVPKGSVVSQFSVE